MESQAEKKFGFGSTIIHHEITCNGRKVHPYFHLQMLKGFIALTTEAFWIAYRRNYFSLEVGYSMIYDDNNAAPTGDLFIQYGEERRLVKALAVELSAHADQANGKVIELVQYSAKRDMGPKNKPQTVKLLPHQARSNEVHVNRPPMGFPRHFAGGIANSGVQLAYQELPDHQATSPPGHARSSSGSSHNSSSPSHIYERVQFKQATQNNGKRRASQQHFVLVVSLMADVRQSPNDQPSWVRWAYTTSDPVVVRGRSPNHYKGDKQAQEKANQRDSDRSRHDSSSRPAPNNHGYHSSSGFYQHIRGGSEPQHSEAVESSENSDVVTSTPSELNEVSPVEVPVQEVETQILYQDLPNGELPHGQHLEGYSYNSAPFLPQEYIMADYTDGFAWDHSTSVGQYALTEDVVNELASAHDQVQMAPYYSHEDPYSGMDDPTRYG